MKKLSNLLFVMTLFFCTATLIAGCKKKKDCGCNKKPETIIFLNKIDYWIQKICSWYPTTKTPADCPWVSKLATAQFDKGFGKNYLLSAVFDNKFLPRYVKFSPGEEGYTKFLKDVPIKIKISYDFEYDLHGKIHGLKDAYFWIRLTIW